MTRILPSLRRLRDDRRGVSAIEFALIGPLLVALMLGAYDLGNAALQLLQLQEAVRSGGAYAGHFPTDVSGIRNAVSRALPANWTLTDPGGLATVTCSCLDPVTGAIAPLDACAPGNFDTCGAGSGLLISVSATIAYVAVDTLFGSALPSLSARYAVRFQ